MGRERKRRSAGIPREPQWSDAAKAKRQERGDLLEALEPALINVRTELYTHQLVCTLIGLFNDTFLYCNDMGTGKTLIATSVFSARKFLRDANQVLVTCPPIILQQWKHEIESRSEHTADIAVGTVEEKLDILYDSTADFVIVSHHWLVACFKYAEEGNIDAAEFAEALGRFDMLVIDECQHISNHTSKGFKGYTKYLLGIPYRYLLTGTPIDGDFRKIWALYYMLDRGLTYGRKYSAFVKEFFNRYVIHTKRTTFPKYSIKAERKPDFFEQFWNRAIRYEEHECGDLPEARYIPLYLPMTDEQEALYDSRVFEQKIEEQYKPWDLIRITGGAYRYKQTPTKLEALELLVDQYVLQYDEQIIIWHWLVEEGRTIYAHLRSKHKTLSMGEVRAEITEAKRSKALAAWRAGKCKVLIANPASLGIGVNLTEASTSVFYSNPDRYLLRRQAEKRTLRDGQKNMCVYYDLICEGTIDQLVLDSIESKADSFASLTRDQQWALIREHRKQPTQSRGQQSLAL